MRDGEISFWLSRDVGFAIAEELKAGGCCNEALLIGLKYRERRSWFDISARMSLSWDELLKLDRQLLKLADRYLMSHGYKEFNEAGNGENQEE